MAIGERKKKWKGVVLYSAKKTCMHPNAERGLIKSSSMLGEKLVHYCLSGGACNVNSKYLATERKSVQINTRPASRTTATGTHGEHLRVPGWGSNKCCVRMRFCKFFPGELKLLRDGLISNQERSKRGTPGTISTNTLFLDTAQLRRNEQQKFAPVIACASRCERV